MLDLAAGHGISVMPVLFDGVWDPDPRPGPQRRGGGRPLRRRLPCGRGGPGQPLTVEIFLIPDRRPELSSRVARTALYRSDVASLHDYVDDETLERTIADLAWHSRPSPAPSGWRYPSRRWRNWRSSSVIGAGDYCWVWSTNQDTFPWTS